MMENILNKKWLMFLVIFVPVVLYGQIEKDYLHLRSYNESMLLLLESSNSSYYVNSAYGKKVNANQSGTQDHPYQYQGQEFISELNLYAFPSRFYSANSIRFHTPDPESQYTSPYLFVNADPVNQVDRDGNRGLPLVLYQQDHNFRHGISPSVKDLMREVPDAYYVPTSFFVNGDVADLPEWNGNVFIKGHMSAEAKDEIMVEEGDHPSMFRSRPRFLNIAQNESGKSFLTIDARKMGSILREFSDARKVDMKNIVSGGCQGTHASKGISEGFLGPSSRLKNQGREVNFFGLKDKHFSFFAGKNATKRHGCDVPLQKTRFHVQHKFQKQLFTEEQKDGKYHFDSYVYEDYPGGPVYDLPYAEGENLEDMLEGRMPQDLIHKFDKIVAEY